MVGSRNKTWTEVADSALVMLKFFGPYTIIIVLILIFGGRQVESRGTVVRMDILLFTYPLGAIVTGGLLGWFESFFSTSKILTTIQGFLAVLPWMAGIALTLDNAHAHWTRGHTIMTLIISAWFGFLLRPQSWPAKGAA